jgi:UDP-glucose 4-epimerase
MILIAGGAGFLGLSTAQQLADVGERVVITTRRRNDTMANALADSSDAITVEFCDLFNEFEVNELFGRYDFDAIIHTATSHMYASSRAANFQSYKMLFNCLEAATNHGVGRFVLCSSIVVYRGLSGPFREDMPLPSDISGNQRGPLHFVPHFEVTLKRANELVALDYGMPMRGWDEAAASSADGASALEVVVTRCPGQFGPRYTSMFSPLSACVHAAVRRQNVSADRTPRDMSDSVYVKDSASTLVTLVQAPELAHRIYNVSSAIRLTAHEFLTTLYELVPGAEQHLGLKIPNATSKSDDYLDISRIQTDLSWKPDFTLETALADYAKWLETHAY